MPCDEALLTPHTGHRLALIRAGILHCGVSVGNILIVDDPSNPDTYAGFLHDFDYSSISRDIPEASWALLSDAALVEKLIADADGGDLKERTVRRICCSVIPY